MNLPLHGSRVRLLAMQALALAALIILLGMAQTINHPDDSLILSSLEGILAFAGYSLPFAFPAWGLAASLIAGLGLGMVMVLLSRKPALKIALLVGLLVVAVGVDYYLWDSGIQSRGVAKGVSLEDTFTDTGANWEPGSLKGYQLYITSGPARGSRLLITDNDASTLYLAGQYKGSQLPEEGQSGYALMTPQGYDNLRTFMGLEMALLVGLPLAAGLYGLVRSSLPGVGLGAVLILLLPLNLSGNTTDNTLVILAFVLTFLIYTELGYAHFRYARYARTMGESADFFGVILWFFGILLAVIFFTTFLTAAAISFHSLLGLVLPERYTDTIEFTTIYGRAISVLAFFAFIALIQSVLARKYLAKPVEKHTQEEAATPDSTLTAPGAGAAQAAATAVAPTTIAPATTAQAAAQAAAGQPVEVVPAAVVAAPAPVAGGEGVTADAEPVEVVK